MQKVSLALLQKHNIRVSTNDCKTKKKRLDEQHRRNPHGQWSKYIAYLRGESDEKPQKVPETSSLEEDLLAVAKFTKGAVMGPEHELSLIDVWRTYKEEYRSAHKDGPFYRKISAQMVLRGHSFSPDQCHYKMNMLVSDFKSYVKAAQRSGGGRPPYWSLYEPLCPILEDMVTVIPEQTFAVGSRNVATRNTKLVPEQPKQRHGRERPRPPSKHDEKKEMMQMIIDSRKEMMPQLKQVALSIRKHPDDPSNSNLQE